MDTSKDLAYYLALPWSFRFEWWEDNGGYYAAHVNELPGCIADGQTMEAALTAIKQLLPEFLQALLEAGNPIPEPVRASDYKGNITYRTTPDKHYRLARVAQQRGISINRLIDEAIDQKLA